MKKQFQGLFVAAAALMCVIGMSTKADAAFIAYICDDALCTGGGDTIVTDQGAGDNFPGSAIVGQINAGAINVGGMTVVTNTSQSKPLIGSASAPQLDLAFTATSNDSVSHTVWLYTSDTGFTGPGGSFALKLGGTQDGAPTSTIQGKVWGGNSNNNLDLSRLDGQTSLMTVDPFSTTVSGSLLSTVSPYSLTIGVVITRASAGTTTGDLKLNVPEPASMALFGLGLMGFAAANRRRKANGAK